MNKLNALEHKQILVRILFEVDQFCRSNDIKYFAAYGTLLGAVRHQGFIPWDDDVDLWMLRQDYDRFLETFPRNSGLQTFIADGLSSTDYPYAYSKVTDRDTCVTEYLYKPYEIGVYIDIFPLDRWPEDEKTYKKILNLHKALKSKTYRFSGYRPFVKNVELMAAKAATAFISKDSIIKRLNELSIGKVSAETKYCGNLMSDFYKEKEKMNVEWYKSTVDMRFEGLNICAPVGYDQVLKTLYGDYMQLPPEDKRVPHHSSDVWKK